MVAGTVFLGINIEVSLSNLTSGTDIVPNFTFTVLDGYFAVSVGVEHNAEKIVDFPTFGSPSIPQFKAMFHFIINSV
jgi:hypothetical protein